MSQDVRNKIYGVITGVLAVLVVVGVIKSDEQQTILGFVNALLDQYQAIVGLIASIIAFVKSLPSRTTTIDIGKHAIGSVTDVEGNDVPLQKAA